jgi:DNA-binding Lrp family transcriptional regulator
MEGGIYMNKNEQVEYQLLEDFREGRKTRKQVALLLGISERSVSRRIRKIREQGISGIKHGNYSRARLCSTALRNLLNLLIRRFFDYQLYQALKVVVLQSPLQDKGAISV